MTQTGQTSLPPHHREVASLPRKARRRQEQFGFVVAIDVLFDKSFHKKMVSPPRAAGRKTRRFPTLPQKLCKVSFSGRLGAMPTTVRLLGMKSTLVVNALVKNTNVISIKHVQRPAGRGHGTHSYIHADFAVLLHSTTSHTTGLTV